MAQAQATPDCSKVVKDCQEVIAKCDTALAEKQKAIDIYSQALDSCRKGSEDLQTRLNIELDKEQSVLRNPIVMVGLGIIAGGLVTLYLTKH